jgi:hypothetical protein
MHADHKGNFGLTLRLSPENSPEAGTLASEPRGGASQLGTEP